MNYQDTKLKGSQKFSSFLLIISKVSSWASHFFPMIWVLFFIISVMAVPLSLAASKYKCEIEADTGFFERNNELIHINFNFKKPVDIKSVKLFKGQTPIPIFIIPRQKWNADIYWILSGAIPSLTKIVYTLQFSEGQWSVVPYGDRKIAETINSLTNLVPNGSFEEVLETDKKLVHWHGTIIPKGWQLRDYAWKYRKLENIKALCRVTGEEAADGKKSIILASELRKNKDTGEKVNLIGFAISDIFPLEPNTVYQFSYQFKFVELEDNGFKYQALSISVNFLDADKQRIYPKDYGINRLQNAFLTTRHSKETFFNKWKKSTYAKKTPKEVRFGQIFIGGSFTGKVYIDNLILKKISSVPAPVKIRTGQIKREE